MKPRRLFLERTQLAVLLAGIAAALLALCKFDVTREVIQAAPMCVKARTRGAIVSIIPDMNINALVIEDERADLVVRSVIKTMPFADALGGRRKSLKLRAFARTR